MVVIVAGSRTWRNRSSVCDVLELVHRLSAKLGSPLTIRHGACPSGVDKMADDWARTKPDVEIDRCPADWQTHGRAGGPVRNGAMAAREPKANMCIAFRAAGESRGTDNMAKVARAHGIATFVIHEEA